MYTETLQTHINRFLCVLRGHAKFILNITNRSLIIITTGHWSHTVFAVLLYNSLSGKKECQQE